MTCPKPSFGFWKTIAVGLALKPVIKVHRPIFQCIRSVLHTSGFLSLAPGVQHPIMLPIGPVQSDKSSP